MAADPPATQGFTAKGRATRERSLAVGGRGVLSEGLSGFNLERVRREAVVSGSQLTHYFADKPALIRAVLSRQIELVLDFHSQPRLGGLETFDDFERWADLNMRYLRRIGYTKTPTYHKLAGQLAKSDDATRQTLADGYRRWVDLLERSFQRMKDRGVLVTSTDPRHLALVVVGGHQGAGTPGFRLPSGVAARRHIALCDQLPANLRRRPRRTDRTQAAPTPHRRTRDIGAGIDDSRRRGSPARVWRRVRVSSTRRRSDVRERRQRDQPRRCAQSGGCERITTRRTTSRISAT